MLTKEEEAKIELTVIKAIETYDEKIFPKIDKRIDEKIGSHANTCGTKISVDRMKWLFIGIFGSGVIGGGTLGAWIASILKGL